MFGIVSSGYSSIAIDMTYDRKRLDEAMRKIMGGGLMPSEIIGTPDGSQGPPEVRFRAHVAFSNAYEILQKLEQVHNRRKAFIYISSGYDFDPFAKSRAKAASERFGSPADPGQVPDTQSLLEDRQRVRRRRSRGRTLGAHAPGQPREHDHLHHRPARTGRRRRHRSDHARQRRLAGSRPRNAKQPARDRGTDRQDSPS